MTKEEKMGLIQRSLALKHKLKVNESMKAPETHEEHSVSLIGRWELEDELKAIELILEQARMENVKEKSKAIQEAYLSGKIPKKKK